MLLEGLGLALEAPPDLRLVLVGRVEPAELDAHALVARHCLERAVHSPVTSTSNATATSCTPPT